MILAKRLYNFARRVDLTDSRQDRDNFEKYHQVHTQHKSEGISHGNVGVLDTRQASGKTLLYIPCEDLYNLTWITWMLRMALCHCFFLLCLSMMQHFLCWLCTLAGESRWCRQHSPHSSSAVYTLWHESMLKIVVLFCSCWSFHGIPHAHYFNFFLFQKSEEEFESTADDNQDNLASKPTMASKIWTEDELLALERFKTSSSVLSLSTCLESSVLCIKFHVSVSEAIAMCDQSGYCMCTDQLERGSW